jgi:DNA-binding YbaB/EbfC family protein
MKNIGELMKKAQQVQSQITILQAKMEKQEFTGEAANGAVRVVLTGKGEAVRVHLDTSVVDPKDTETLEDLILIAINDSRTKSEETQTAEMEKIQASLGLPPGFKMPF